MATPVQMPKVGISVESCVLTKWHRQVGEQVKKGDVLFTYETDKTTVDEEALEDGVMLAHFFKEGDDVPVMQYVCVIGKAGEDYAQFAPAAEAEEPAKQEVKEVKVEVKAEVKQAEAIATAPAKSEDGRLKISPRARVLADRTGVNPAQASASGAEGRIVEKDIAALAASGGGLTIGEAAVAAEKSLVPAGAPEGGYYDEKLTSVRKFIAKAMHESISSMAQLTNNHSFDATNILNFRAMLKEKGAELGLPNITINDIILYTVSRVLLNHKLINAHFLGDSMRYFTNAHVGIAVDTERGLLVPTLFNADKLSLAEIAVQAKTLAKSAQEGNIAPDLLKGASFTVTNLGTLGVESFTPIVNPPQTCILGVNTLKDAIKVVNGEIKAYKSMTLSLTYDHRAVDGAPAAKFVKEVCTALENFSLLLAK